MYWNVRESQQYGQSLLNATAKLCCVASVLTNFRDQQMLPGLRLTGPSTAKF